MNAADRIRERVRGSAIHSPSANGTAAPPADDGLLAPAAATRVAGQVAREVATLHAARRVHGNLTPGGLLLGPDGLARLAPPGPQPHAADLAPRRRADLRAVAALYHGLLTGRPPAAGEGTAGLPEPCRMLLDALLGDSPESGCAGAEELAAALECVEEMLTAGEAPVAAATGAGGPTVIDTWHSSAPGARAPAGPALEVGGVFGKCLLTEQIGRGSSGLVFRALHQTLKIPVAVKVLPLAAGDEGARRQLRAEARLLAQLNHPNVVRVWDFEDGGDYPFVVLEYVEGFSLAELLAVCGRLLPDRAARVVRQVAEGLAAAQVLGIVHRDVKPGNILLARTGTAKLADLGLAVVAGGPAASPDRPGGPLTGTVAYMAPEQARHAPSVDHRADIYALGATLFHAVTGRLPFPGRSPSEVLIQHATQAPPAPHELVADVPPALSAVILRMLAKAPADRHQTYDELLADLAAPGAAGPPPPPVERRERRPSALWSLLGMNRRNR